MFKKDYTTYEPIVATGGTITTAGNFRVHTFTASGTFQITNGTGEVEILMVGGGGGAGSYSGGGGGGEVLSIQRSVNSASYVITIGAGGAGLNTGAWTDARHGSPTTAFSETAKPGGGGK